MDRIQIFGLLGGILLLILVLELVRRKKLLEGYSLIWILVCLGLVVVSLWKSLWVKIAGYLGIFYPPVGGLPFKNIKKELANFHWYTLSEQIEFPKVLKSANLDLMHFPHFNVPYAYSKPFIITIHDLTLHRHKTIRASTKNLLTYNLKHWLYKKIIKRSAKKALKIFTPSEFTKTEIIKILKIRPEKIIVTKEG